MRINKLIFLIIILTSCGSTKESIYKRESNYKILSYEHSDLNNPDSCKVIGKIYDGDLTIPPLFETQIWINKGAKPYITDSQGSFIFFVPQGVNKLFFYNSNDSQLIIDTLLFKGNSIMNLEIRLGYSRIK